MAFSAYTYKTPARRVDCRQAAGLQSAGSSTTATRAKSMLMSQGKHTGSVNDQQARETKVELAALAQPLCPCLEG